MTEQVVHQLQAHLFQIDPVTKKNWLPLGSNAGLTVTFYYDAVKKSHRIVGTDATGKTLLASNVANNMAFAKSSAKFGQWEDHKEKTIYGAGFSSEAELTAFSDVFVQAVKTAPGDVSPSIAVKSDGEAETSKPKGRALYDFAGTDETHLSFKSGQIITAVSATKSEGWSRGTVDDKTGRFPTAYVQIIQDKPPSVAEKKYKDERPRSEMPPSQKSLAPTAPESRSRSPSVGATGSEETVRELRAQLEQTRKELEQSKKDMDLARKELQSKEDRESLAAIASGGANSTTEIISNQLLQVKNENDKLKAALAQSSMNQQQWEAELQTLRNNNARLMTALQESAANVDLWVQQITSYTEGSSKNVQETPGDRANTRAICGGSSWRLMTLMAVGWH
eukprot:Opistho-2@62644